MGAGAFLEPLTVIVLLFGGAWINRSPDSFLPTRNPLSLRSVEDDTDVPELPQAHQVESEADLDIEKQRISKSDRSPSPSLLPSQEDRWRQREVKIPLLGYGTVVQTPNTAVFRHRLVSRILHKFPFLVEAWYWALLYWVGSRTQICQLLVWTNMSAPTGLPARPRIHSCDDRRRHGPCCSSACPSAD